MLQWEYRYKKSVSKHGCHISEENNVLSNSSIYDENDRNIVSNRNVKSNSVI